MKRNNKHVNGGTQQGGHGVAVVLWIGAVQLVSMQSYMKKLKADKMNQNTHSLKHKHTHKKNKKYEIIWIIIKHKYTIWSPNHYQTFKKN